MQISSRYRPSGALLLILLIAITACYGACLPMVSRDATDFLFPWYDFILSHGRWRAMGMTFANYTPPYLYLLATGSLLDGMLTPLQVIKLLSVLGNALLGLAVYDLGRSFASRRWRAAVGLGIMLLPSVVANGPAWGQCDALYTAAVVLSIGFALRGRWVLHMVAIGVAVAFKQQTMFIAPALLALLLRGHIRWWMIPIPAAVYYALMVPALLAGRSLAGVTMIYFQQFDTYKVLSICSTSLWELLNVMPIVSTPYGPSVFVGLELGILATVLIARQGLDMRVDRPETMLLLFTAPALILPYLLPKMHDRYVFTGTVLAVALAAYHPTRRTIRLALMAEAAAFIAAFAYLTKIFPLAFYGSAIMTVAVWLVWRMLRDATRPDQPAASG